jgi:CubicO group peptidase (beta-lactamase class C family)
MIRPSRALALLVALMITAAACSSSDATNEDVTADTAADADTDGAGNSGDDDSGATAVPAVFPTADEWAITDPSDVDVDQANLDALDDYLEGTGSNCMAVVKDGHLIDEHYWNDFDATTEQEIFSASKSYTSTLVGIAQDQGHLDITQPASDFITEWQGTDSEDVTIQNLLSNNSGRYWDFETDYLTMAVGSPDRTEFAISLDQQFDPGTEWEYNNSAIQTLEAVIERSTGQDMEDFAKENLFGPLGMNSTISRDQAGNPAAFMGVQSNCLDMARFGYLFLQEGNWDGTQVVSADWVAEASAASQELNTGYGYLWWRNTDEGYLFPGGGAGEGVFWPGAPLDAYAALGLGDQIVLILPSQNMVVTRIGPFKDTGDDPSKSTSVAEVARLVTGGDEVDSDNDGSSQATDPADESGSTD